MWSQQSAAPALGNARSSVKGTHERSYGMNINLVFYNTFSGRRDFEMKTGSRKWHAILILKEGCISFTINGREYTAGKDEIAFFPGNLFLTRRVLEPITFHQLAFFVTPEHPYFSSMQEGLLSLPKNHVHCLIETLDNLVYRSENHKTRIYCSLIDQIILENHLYRTEDAHQRPQLDATVYEALRYINTHLGEKISIPDIAAHVHLSNIGLIWKFRTLLGCTPSEMVLVLRMQYAKYLLLESHKSVKEVAALCGYSNPFYFSNVFQRYFHHPPSKYSDVFNAFRTSVSEGKVGDSQPEIPSKQP